MKDMLLLVAVAAVFAFGWFLTGKLDEFLKARFDESENDEIPAHIHYLWKSQGGKFAVSAQEK